MFDLLLVSSDLAQIGSLTSGTTDYIIVIVAIFGNILRLDRVGIDCMSDEKRDLGIATTDRKSQNFLIMCAIF